MTKWISILCLLTGFLTPLAAGTNNMDLALHNAFKGSGVIEKIHVTSGRDAVYKGVTYDLKIEFTINGNFTTLQGEEKTTFFKRSFEKIRTLVKTKNGLMVFSKPDGFVIDAVEFATH
ncbi:MAG TPA: hypothetical protein PK014_11760 [Thermoanaerobaculia bacterium]|nr:hypothetical protein [Thermoanaerobaculia bacterium]HUM30757.1 hypothetical protein [Thermoanaerobaculia bacterium]HXK69043.1 hypothetical protein [Thermoanaerobaculia bacterium]